MKKNIITGLLVLPVFVASCFAVGARADEPKHEQEDSLSDNRMKVLYYDANDVYTILTRVGYESYIEFSPHEEIDTISVGERSFWQLIPAGNRLFVRPLRNDIATDMTVITNKHAYQFDLKSTGDEKASILYVARFSYPEEERQKMRMLRQNTISNPFMPNAALQAQITTPPPTIAPQPPINAEPVAPPQPTEQPAAQQPPAGYQPSIQPPPAQAPAQQPVLIQRQEAPVTKPRLAEIPPVDKRNYHYSFSGPEAVSPYEVFDDGSTTYFRYNPPALMAPEAGMLEKDGTETAITVYQNGPYFAVDVVVPKLLLHTTTGTAYVFNETIATHP